MVKTSLSSAGGADGLSDPGREAKIPHASQPENQNIHKKKQCCTDSIKTLKVVHNNNKILKE